MRHRSGIRRRPARAETIVLRVSIPATLKEPRFQLFQFVSVPLRRFSAACHRAAQYVDAAVVA
eukprot:2442337-Pleurochrysis_carterae.AAC.1